MRATTIYLVRHAHADWQHDEARPLSEAGLKASQVVSTLLSALPITAIYSSPARRSVETVTPLADRLRIRPELVHDLRERELPVAPSGEFDRIVADTWRSPESATAGAESNVNAQSRGLAAVRSILTRHVGQHVVVSTHGTLLALILNGLDSAFGYDFWRRLSSPDVFRLEFEGTAMTRVERIWDLGCLTGDWSRRRWQM
jgi:broad specificity phosphatase PhoE